MGRAFEYRKAAKLKRWGHMAKTFTRLGKQIAIAVKAGGPEPENNPTLRSVIATCKRENMPKDNIERAIKNAMGKDQSDYKGMTYEGYGPHGIAVFVDTLTDNTTRTVADVRSVFNKFGGNLGTTGSLAFLFDHKCVFTFKKKEGIDMEELILDLIDYNVEDEFDEDPEEGTITIYGDPKSYAAIQKHLEECGFEDVGGDFTYIPNDLKEVTPEQRETLDKMIERLEELHQVLKIYGIDKYVSVELGIVSNYQYYTGIIFAGYTFGSGEPIVKGGRYDELLTYFGKESASIGFAIVIDQLMAALSRQKIEIPVQYQNELIIYGQEMRSEAVKKAMELRKCGSNVELMARDISKTEEDYRAYAEQNHCVNVTFM